MGNNFYLVKFKSDKVKLGHGLIALGLANYAFKDVPFSTGIAIFDPGVSIPLHSHNSDEQITILSGNGIAEIEGKVFPVEKFDTTYIQKDIPHRFINTGKSKLIIQFVYGIDYATRTDVETGQTMSQFPEEGGVNFYN